MSTTALTDSNVVPLVPVITGGAGSLSTNSTAPVEPFAGVTITDPNAGATEMVTITLNSTGYSTYGGSYFGGSGQLSDGSGFTGLTQNSSGGYVLTGTAAAVNSELDALQFTVFSGQPGTGSNTSFTVNDTSSAAPASPVQAYYGVNYYNPLPPPTIYGIQAGQKTTSEAPIQPFAGVLITDIAAAYFGGFGGATDSLTITLSGAGGTLSGNGLTPQSNSVYSLTESPYQISSYLQALTFTPTSGAAGTTSTTSFTLSDSDIGGSVSDSTTTITDIDPLVPIIAGGAGSLSTSSTAPVEPFAGVTITDPNAGATETVTITFNTTGYSTYGGSYFAGSGQLSDGSSFTGLTQNSSGGYELTGTAAAVSSELEALQFTLNAYGGPGTGSNTIFTVSDTSSAAPASPVQASYMVNEYNPLPPPTINGTHAGQTTTSEAPIQPFAGVSINDPAAYLVNYGGGYGTATDSLTITLSGAGGTLKGNGLTQQSSTQYSVYESANSISSYLQALSFTPIGRAPGTTSTTTFTLADSNLGGSVSDSTTTVTDIDPLVPIIAGGASSLSTNSTAPVEPFASVTITDPNAGATETVTITFNTTGYSTYGGSYFAGSGQLSDGSSFTGLTQNSSGAYVLSGTPAMVSSELDALQFTVFGGQPGTGSNTSFTVSDTSSAAPASPVQAYYGVNYYNPLPVPTIYGTQAGQTTTSEAPIQPFAGVLITDIAAAYFGGFGGTTDSLTITLSGAGGTLSGNGLTQQSSSVYSLTESPYQITSYLQALTFTPTSGAAGTTSTTSFTLSDSDIGGSVSDSTTTVTDIDPLVPIIAGGAGSLSTNSIASVEPFAGVTITDPNAGATETVTITLNSTGYSTYGGSYFGGSGQLSDGSGFTGLTQNSSGGYVLTGTAAAVSSELDALQFTVFSGQPGTGSNTSFTVNDTSSAAPASPVQAYYGVNYYNPLPPPTIYGTQAGQTTTSEAPIQPFAGVFITDIAAAYFGGFGGATDSLTITLSGAGGALSGNGLTQQSSTVYSLTESAYLISSYLQALTFTPTAGTAGTTSTTTFTLSDSDIGGSVTDSTTTVIDIDPASFAEDGYIVGATVAYLNGSSSNSAITGANGAFSLTGGSGPLVLTGGTDSATGLAFTGTLEAPAGSNIVSPLTSLVQTLIAATGDPLGLANADVVTALGLTPGTDLTTLDVVAGTRAGDAAATAAFQAGSQLLDVTSMIDAAGGTAGAALQFFANRISGGTALNLADPTTIVDAGTTAGLDTSAATSVANIAVATATALAAQIAGVSPSQVFDDVTGASIAEQGGVVAALAKAVANGSGSTADTALQTISSHYTDPTTLAETLAAADTTASNNVPCYCRGTRILTTAGEVAIEELAVGDLVVTASGAPRPVRWIGHRRLVTTGHPEPHAVWPVQVTAGAFAPRQPARDLWLSPGHNIVAEGVLMPIGALINGTTIVQHRHASTEYWHVELDAHDIVFAEGLAAESYLDTGTRTDFSNGGAFVRAFPDFAPRHQTQTCLPLVAFGPEIKRVKAALLAREGRFTHSITGDANMHLIADLKRFSPVRIDRFRYGFLLPRNATGISLHSRHFVPSYRDPECDDRRSLGVCVSAVQIDSISLDLDEVTRFNRGWHKRELSPQGCAFRWTDGNASFADGSRLITIELAATGHYLVSHETHVISRYA